MHGVTWHFSSKKLKKILEKHETLVDVISCHQDDVVKKFGHTPLTNPSQTGATH